MRVGLVILAPGIGGVSRHVFDLADGLCMRGHEVKVFCRRDAIAIQEIAVSSGLGWDSLAAAPRANADVWHVHLHNPLDLKALPLLAACRLRRAGGVILTEHLPRHPRTELIIPKNLPKGGRWSRRKPGAKYVKTAMKHAQFALCDWVIAVSERSADFIAARYGLGPPKLVTVFNGVAVPESLPALCPAVAQMRVVTIGDLHWRKGIDVLLQACAVAREDWSLAIVGDGVARPALETQAAELAGDRSIRFEGYRRDGARAPLEADVVCVPSRAESFSYVILEAMAAGRPVVASDVDGARDAIVDHEHGLLVPPDDPERLARALDSLAADPQTRARMGRLGHLRAMERFTIDRMVEATIVLYKGSLAPG